MTTRSEYKQRALELIQSPVSETILGYKMENGQIVRYDKERNDYVKGRPKQGIATMFKPKDAEKYYNRQLKKDGGIEND